jgi:hypothetical protein
MKSAVYEKVTRQLRDMWTLRNVLGFIPEKIFILNQSAPWASLAVNPFKQIPNPRTFASRESHRDKTPQNKSPTPQQTHWPRPSA